MATENACKLLQTWWRRLLTKSEVVGLRLLDSRGSFDEFAEFLGERDTIRKVKHFLVAHCLSDVNPRLYLAAFMVYHWGDTVTGVKEGRTPNGMDITPQEEISWALRKEAARLIRVFSTAIMPMVGSPRCVMRRKKESGIGHDATTGNWETMILKNRYETLNHALRVWGFTKIFRRWKDMDKKSILDHMCYNYTELSNCRNMMQMEGAEATEYTEQILEYIEQQQLKIKGHIEELGGTGSFDTVFSAYRPVKLSCSYSQMREVMQKAFWDKVTEDMAKTPPDHKHVMVLFDEVKTSIKLLIPSRTDMHEKMDAAVDTELIDQMIRNKAFSHNDLLAILGYLINMIRTLEPPIEDGDTDDWKEEVMRECRSREPWRVIIPKFFKRIFGKIEGIRESVEVLRTNTGKAE